MPVDYNREVGDHEDAKGEGEERSGKECVNRRVGLAIRRQNSQASSDNCLLKQREQSVTFIHLS